MFHGILKGGSYGKEKQSETETVISDRTNSLKKE